MEGSTKENGGPITKLQLLLLRLQGTPAENLLAHRDLLAEPVLLLSLTYTRENRCTSGAWRTARPDPTKKNRTNGNPMRKTIR